MTTSECTCGHQRRWMSVQEAADRLEKPYREVLALVQDRKLSYRLRNPDAPNRRIYQVSVKSVEEYERNTTVYARQ